MEVTTEASLPTKGPKEIGVGRRISNVNDLERRLVRMIRGNEGNKGPLTPQQMRNIRSEAVEAINRTIRDQGLTETRQIVRGVKRQREVCLDCGQAISNATIQIIRAPSETFRFSLAEDLSTRLNLDGPYSSLSLPSIVGHTLDRHGQSLARGSISGEQQIEVERIREFFAQDPAKIVGISLFTPVRPLRQSKPLLQPRR